MKYSERLRFRNCIAIDLGMKNHESKANIEGSLTFFIKNADQGTSQLGPRMLQNLHNQRMQPSDRLKSRDHIGK